MEGHAAVELVGTSDLASETLDVSASSSSSAAEAQTWACTAGPDFHIPGLDAFYLRCVQEDGTDEAEPWGTGDLPYRSILGTCNILGTWQGPRVRVLPSPALGGIVDQLTAASVAGHTGIPVAAMGVFCLRLPLSHIAVAPQVWTGTQAPAAAAAQRPPGAPAGEAGPVEGRSGGIPRADSPRPRGAEEPTGGCGGWSGQRPGRRPRVQAITLVQDLSRVGLLARDSLQACPICLVGIRSGELARTLPCFHMMHNACSRRYFRTWGVPPNCPVCRSSIAPSHDETSR